MGPLWPRHARHVAAPSVVCAAYPLLLTRTVRVRDTASAVLRGQGSAGRATTKVGDLVHIDPMAMQKRAWSLGGHHTAMVLVDDYSGFCL